jgi:GNAT superfamily N-acetyltransferase
MSDFVLLSEFRSLFPGNDIRSTSKEYYEWKILKNPYKRGRICLEYRGDTVAGSASITPKSVSVCGKTVVAAEIGDTFTHREFRRQGIFAAAVRACTDFAISEGIEVIYGTPNSQSLPGYKNKLSYPICRFAGVNSMMKYRWSLLTLIKSMVKLILGRGPDSFLRYASVTLKHAISSITPRRKHNAGRTGEPFEIGHVHKFTDEIDGFWGDQRYVFFTIRDRTYLNWRYADNPDGYRIVAAKNGNRYLGYVVTKLSWDGKTGVICDFITLNDRPDVFHQLIARAEKELYRAGAQCIQCWCVENSPYYRGFLNQGYFEQGPEYRQPVIVFSETDYGKALLNTDGRWHFVWADSDNV